jgi:hypothetical protein
MSDEEPQEEPEEPLEGHRPSPFLYRTVTPTN